MHFFPFCPVAGRMAELNPEGKWMQKMQSFMSGSIFLIKQIEGSCYFAYYFSKFLLFLVWFYEGVDIENRRS